MQQSLQYQYLISKNADLQRLTNKKNQFKIMIILTMSMSRKKNKYRKPKICTKSMNSRKQQLFVNISKNKVNNFQYS